MQLNYPVYPDLTHPKGFLPDDKRAQACWYFYTLAQQLKERLGTSVDDQFGILEGNKWMDPHYAQLARSVARIYALESPDEFAKFWRYVKQQAESLGYPTPAAVYMNPLQVVIH